MTINRTNNQKFIHALLKGQTIQLRSAGEEWYDFDINWYVENEDPFGPWNCASCYEWRIKPEFVEINITKTVVVNKVVNFEFENVKKTPYKKGDSIYYLDFSNGEVRSKAMSNVNHDQSQSAYPQQVFFHNQEDLDKAFALAKTQLEQTLKGN